MRQVHKAGTQGRYSGGRDACRSRATDHGEECKCAQVNAVRCACVVITVD